MPVTITVEGPIAAWAQVARLGEWVEQLGGMVRQVKLAPLPLAGVAYEVEIAFPYHGGTLTHWVTLMPATFTDMRALVTGQPKSEEAHP